MPAHDPKGGNTTDDLVVLSRRHFLRKVTSMALAASALSLPRLSFGASRRQINVLHFEHAHTGETLSLTYRIGERYVPTALRAVNRFLRDFRTGEIHPIDPQLLDILNILTKITQTRGPFQVISGYRSLVTNEMLRRHHSGVAKSSMHIEGRAVDIYLPDVPLSDLRDAAAGLRLGGVGFYPAANFVHVDTGRVRYW
jgi:uncharacterized protein YcbK (DUF882 family)